MKQLTLAAVAVSLMAAPLAAQETTQASVNGPSGDPTYSVQITGANGEIYNCRPDIQTVAGQLVRRCQRLSGVVNGQLLGGSLSTGGALAAGAVLVLLAAGSSSTTTTN